MSRLEAVKEMITGKDVDGNLYIVNPDNKIYIRHPNTDRMRMIGFLASVNEKEIAYVKHEEESQRFRKTNAWSIVWQIAKFVDLIYFITKKESYKLTRDEMTINGQFFHFSSSTEKKIYVPVDKWQKKSDIDKSAVTS